MDKPGIAVEQSSLLPNALLIQIASGAMLTQAVGVTAKLGIADLILDGSANIDDLAKATGAHTRSLFRVLRSLASVGVFRESAPRTFENTPMSNLLRSGSPDSLKNFAIFMAEPWHYNIWGNMLHSVMTGEAAWKKTHGQDVFEWFQQNPEAAENFNKTMTEMSTGVAPVVVEAYDFSGIDILADIAGGLGYLMAQILKANPDLKGILFDVESVINSADAMLNTHGVADRVEKVSGDFFKEVPPADAYIMKHIIHDWDDERSVLIMKNIHRAMKGDGKLLLVEMIVPAGNDPHYSKILDLEMLTSPGGIERSEDEYRELLAQAGFRLSRIVPTKSPFSVIEAVKA
jgi:hypothetical protein